MLLAVVLGSSAIVATTSSATPADNTPGGAQVGDVAFRSPSPDVATWHTDIGQSGPSDGLYTYTVTRSYDHATVLTATGTGYLRANARVGDAFLVETMTGSGRQIRIWDTSAKPAVLLLDESFGCTDSTSGIDRSCSMAASVLWPGGTLR